MHFSSHWLPQDTCELQVLAFTNNTETPAKDPWKQSLRKPFFFTYSHKYLKLKRFHRWVCWYKGHYYKLLSRCVLWEPQWYFNAKKKDANCSCPVFLVHHRSRINQLSSTMVSFFFCSEAKVSICMIVLVTVEWGNTRRRDNLYWISGWKSP